MTLAEQRKELQTAGRARANVAQVSLIDLIDRLLQGGIVIQGEIVLSAADVDLVKVDLALVIAAVDTLTTR